MVQGNGMDLSLFQFDYDMSFAVTFLNSDRQVLGRYGSRNKRPDNADSEISVKGLMESMKAARVISRKSAFPAKKYESKNGDAPKYKTPEEHPHLAEKYDSEIIYGKNVAKSCIHCHQIRGAERRSLREAGTPFPDKVLFPYPMPSILGLTFDKDTRATIKNVAPDSVAANAQIKPGEVLLELNGQLIISLADIQWVLHNAPDSGELVAKTDSRTVRLPLEPGWRKKSDISWRVSTWDLRRMTFGGMKLEPLPEDERKRLGIAAGKMALLAAHVGQYNEHAVAKRAGAVKGDILIAYDGLDADLRETDLIAHAMQKRKSGDEIGMTILRNGQTKTLKILLPK